MVIYLNIYLNIWKCNGSRVCNLKMVKNQETFFFINTRVINLLYYLHKESLSRNKVLFMRNTFFVRVLRELKNKMIIPRYDAW